MPLKFDQVGLVPAGLAGSSRSDGKLDGAQVTVTSTGGGAVHQAEMLWAPDGDKNGPVSFVQATATTWTFTPSPGCPGTYRIRLTVDGVIDSTREFRVRTHVLGLVIPAVNELADPHASRANSGALFVAASEDNEIEPLVKPALSVDPPSTSVAPFSGGSYAGWYKALRDSILTVEELATSLDPHGLWNVLQSIVTTDDINYTVAPNVGGLYFDVFFFGTRYRVEGPLSVAIPNVDGLHVFYLALVGGVPTPSVEVNPTPSFLVNGYRYAIPLAWFQAEVLA
jgi:hypothetical protein